jgi:bacterioferritin-associated ferredoxin
MFVCMCRAVKLSRLGALIDAGAVTVDAVEAACGAGGDCGTCRDEIADVIRTRLSGLERQRRAA